MNLAGIKNVLTILLSFAVLSHRLFFVANLQPNLQNFPADHKECRVETRYREGSQFAIRATRLVDQVPCI